MLYKYDNRTMKGKDTDKSVNKTSMPREKTVNTSGSSASAGTPMSDQNSTESSAHKPGENPKAFYSIDQDIDELVKEEDQPLTASHELVVEDSLHGKKRVFLLSLDISSTCGLMCHFSLSLQILIKMKLKAGHV